MELIHLKPLKPNGFGRADPTFSPGDRELLGGGVDPIQDRQESAAASVGGGNDDCESCGIQLGGIANVLERVEDADLESESGRFGRLDGRKPGVMERSFAGHTPGFLDDVRELRRKGADAASERAVGVPERNEHAVAGGKVGVLQSGEGPGHARERGFHFGTGDEREPVSGGLRCEGGICLFHGGRVVPVR